MRKFCLKLTLFLAPFAVAMALELFVLPLDAFTFRVWEAVYVYHFDHLLPGPMYPNLRLRRLQTGDLGNATPYGVKTEIDWTTDRNGFRFDAATDPSHSIQGVIVGDSFTAGLNLSQHEMLNEVLGRKLGRRVYPYSYRNLNDFLQDPRFTKLPIKFVIWECAEPGCIQETLRHGLPPPRTTLNPGLETDDPPVIQKLIVLGDRFCKAAMLHHFRDQITRYLVNNFPGRSLQKTPDIGEYVQWSVDRRMLFYRMDIAPRAPLPPDAIRQFADTLRQYRDVLRDRGITLVFFPIPGKSTVYYKRVPMPPDTLLTDLERATQEAGVETVDYLTAVRQTADSSSEFLYQFDDVHWNPRGVELGATLLGHKISQLLK